MEQASRRLEIGVPIEAPAQIGQPDVEWERVESKPPAGHPENGPKHADRDHGKGIPERHPPAQVRVCHSGHLVPSPRVVGPQTPTEGVEVEELPRVQQPSQHKCPGIQVTCARHPAHQRGDGAHERPHPRVGYAEPLQRRVDGRIEEYVGGSEEGSERVNHGCQERRTCDAGGDAKRHGMGGAGKKGERSLQTAINAPSPFSLIQSFLTAPPLSYDHTHNQHSTISHSPYTYLITPLTSTLPLVLAIWQSKGTSIHCKMNSISRDYIANVLIQCTVK